MTFISPQLASPSPDRYEGDPRDWVVQEKYDGHRLIVSTAETGGDLFGNQTTRAWSRYGAERSLPPHVRAAIERLPSGIYDGELLVPGHRSYGVTELVNASRLVYVMFDVLELMGRSVTGETQSDRRKLLEVAISRVAESGLTLAWQRDVVAWDDVGDLARAVWDRDGEGLILKRSAASYRPGKRVRDWLKVKQLRSTVMTVVGFKAGRLGPHATVMLRDDDDNETAVKTLNDEERQALDRSDVAAVGRRLRVEYQERTMDGGYRHPRWDRWESE